MSVPEKPKRKTTTSTEVKRRYMDKTYTRLYVEVPKETATQFKAATEKYCTTTAAVFKEAVQKFIDEHPVN